MFVGPKTNPVGDQRAPRKESGVTGCCLNNIFSSLLGRPETNEDSE